MLVHLSLPLVAWIFFGLGLIVAVFYDLRYRRIPNWVNASLLGTGMAVHVMVSSLRGGAWSLGGAGVGVLLLLYPFSKRWIGAGDVKLFAAMGAWLGPLLTLQALLASALCGGLVSLFFVLRAPRGQRRAILTNLRFAAYVYEMPDIEVRAAKDTPPYALALAVGALIIFVLQRRNLV